MPVQVNPSPQALNWNFYRVVNTDPDDAGMSASTGWSMRAINIAVTKGDEGVRVKSLIVSVGLDRSQCWVVKGTKTKALLDHERLHYVFAALVGSELFATVLDLRGTSVDDLQAQMLRAQSDAVARIDEISSSYDDDTSHGNDVGEQARWQAQVQSWQTNKQIDW